MSVPFAPLTRKRKTVFNVQTLRRGYPCHAGATGRGNFDGKPRIVLARAVITCYKYTDHVYDSSNHAATAMLRGLQRPDLQDGVHSVGRSVDWRVRSSLARRLGVGTAVDVADVAVVGESIAPDSVVFHFGKV